MWIGNLSVVLIISGCAALMYLKGTVVKAFATMIVTVCASVAAFGFFEISAKLLLRYAASVGPWAQPLCFTLLFVLAFGILQTAASYLTRQQTDLGLWPERVGRVVCGIFLGLIVSGLLLTALAMAPLPSKYPYERFDPRYTDAEKPKKVFLNADGLATGWFSMMSNGSLSAIRNKRSFASLHPALLDQLFLNRLGPGDNLSIMTASPAIEVQNKNACWFLSGPMTDSDGKQLSPKSGHNLLVVRVGIKRSASKDAGKFTLSQLRLICKPKAYADKPLVGKGHNIYPVGYMKAANQLQKKKLNDPIQIDFTDRVRLIDFAFYVPDGSVPVLVQFKLNNVAEVPLPVATDQAPEIIPFIESAASETSGRSSDQRQSPRPREVTIPKKRRGLSGVSKGILGDDFE